MASHTPVSHLSEAQLRQMAAQLMAQLDAQQARHAAELSQRDKTLQHYKLRNEQLTHELALLKRHRFGQRSEAGSPQYRLLDDIVEEDLAAVESELAQLVNTPATTRTPRKPARQSLPPELPRTEIHHDPESTLCTCGCQLTCIGEDISEKLDYAPGQFSVERHIRSKWACKQCETIVQAPVAPHVIDKGIPTT